MNQDYFIAIDLGGTSAKCAIVKDNKAFSIEDINDNNNSNVKFFTVLTNVDKELNSNSILKNIDRAIKSELKKENLEWKHAFAIGLTIPGKYNYDSGNVSLAPNINWKNYALKEELEKIWPEKFVVYLNDADAAALGQYHISKIKNLIVYTVGTGIGGAVIKNGKLLIGDDGYSIGEFGHIGLEDNTKYSDLKCNCDQIGCLETVASASAINKAINNYVQKNPRGQLAMFKNNNHLKSLDTNSLNSFFNKNIKNNSAFLTCDYLLRPALGALAMSINNILKNSEFKENYSVIIAGGGTKISNFMEIFSEEITKYDQKSKNKVTVAPYSDKVGLLGIMLFTLESWELIKANNSENRLLDDENRKTEAAMALIALSNQVNSDDYNVSDINHHEEELVNQYNL